MKKSANSGMHSGRVGRTRYPMEENIAFLAYLGFEVLDINFSASIYEGEEKIDVTLPTDGWKENVRAIGREAGKRGMRIRQSHLPFYEYWNPGLEKAEFMLEMVRRALEASAMLGVEWAVLHPSRFPDAQEAERATREYLDPLMEEAERLGVGIAVENMTRKGTYGSDAATLCRLVDGFGPRAGICWDTGHANLSGISQAESLRAVGDRLKCLHVHDNFGKGDDHRPPFMGTVDWREVMRALREIGYRGDLNFEVNATNLPERMRVVHGEYVTRAADVLIAMFEGVEP